MYIQALMEPIEQIIAWIQPAVLWNKWAAEKSRSPNAFPAMNPSAATAGF